MKMEVSAKVGSGGFGKKPHVKKGYYAGQLILIEPHAKQDGTLIEGKYGRQIRAKFQVFDQDAKNQVYYEDEQKNKQPLILVSVLNSEYKNPKTGEYQTAVTKNSRITKVFEALGWKFDPTKPVDTDDLIGNWVELNIDDYEATVKDANGLVTETYKASIIKDINKFEGELPNPYTESKPQKPISKPTTNSYSGVKLEVKEESVLDPETQKRVDNLKKLHAEGFLSDEGLKKGLEQLYK